MRIAFAASELAPFAQSGGLGDAVAGLARALGARGHRVSCWIPGHRGAFETWARAGEESLGVAGENSVPIAGRTFAGPWRRGTIAPNVDVELWDVPTLWDRPALYGFGDDEMRFVAFARAVAHHAEAEQPDVLVAHDWHAALAIALLRTSLDRGANRRIGTVQAIHNAAYQGRLEPSAMPWTGLPSALFHPDGIEAWGEICLLKAGLGWADRLVAVSPTYAREIQTAAFGEGLDGLYRARAHRLVGIVNGIDVERFDPAKDTEIAAHFDAAHMEGRDVCRAAVLEELDLATPPPGRFLASIGRFALQKGWDVLADALDELVERGASIALLGDGDLAISEELVVAGRRHPDRIAVRTGFDESLARRLYAGSDAVLVPSRFEPCGLVQRLAQRYGALPVAHAAGGLMDTIADPVFDAAPEAPSPAALRRTTGVLFSPLEPEELVSACERVAKMAGGSELARVQRRLLGLDVSWKRPAAEWEAVLTAAQREGIARS